MNAEYQLFWSKHKRVRIIVNSLSTHKECRVYKCIMLCTKKNRCTRCNCYIWCNCCTSVTFVNSAPTVPKTQEPPPADGGEPSKFLEMFDFVDLIFKMLLMIPIWDQKIIQKNQGLMCWWEIWRQMIWMWLVVTKDRRKGFFSTAGGDDEHLLVCRESLSFRHLSFNSLSSQLSFNSL